MIGFVEARLRLLRRRLSRSEWLIRLLRLDVSKDSPRARGLILIQIDGLGRTQLEHALEAGRMPFLKRLLSHEHYHLHTLYSGLPSSTPAAQAELFYGVRTAVPAFGFIEPSTGRAARMSDPATARSVEERLTREGRKPLLEEGSAYVNIFTGGAAEAHFCASALGWGPMLQGLRLRTTVALLLAHLPSLLRIAGLLVVETVLALVDFLRGIIAGQDLIQELKFVPARVSICIFLREVATVGACLDAARGMPIVHLNYVGYDEQAHRRGPSSLFAHWTLKGIDAAVARVWKAAKRAHRRDYDVWIYSDHGQATALTFAEAVGRDTPTLLRDAIREALDGPEDPATQAEARSQLPDGIEKQRVRLLGGHRLQGLLPPAPGATGEPEFVLSALGPVGTVHLKGGPYDGSQRLRVAEHVVRHGVPLALACDDTNTVHAFTGRGRFVLPKEAGAVLGHDHPFLHDAARDLVALVRHAAAGDVVICGWCANAGSLTFNRENGSHGGPSPQEVTAFALLPVDAPVVQNSETLRPETLRHAAMRWLGGGIVAPEPKAGHLRLMTYNVHSCRGMDGHTAPERVARVIAAHHPDIVCLQELDVERRRTGGVDQAHLIAKALEMDFHFHPSLRLEEEQYGNAVLSRLPMRLLRAGPLTGPRNGEPRGAIKVEIMTPDGPLQLVATHLGVYPRERRQQSNDLVRDGWLDTPPDVPLILCGDFNAMPGGRVYRRLCGCLSDVQQLAPKRPRPTFPGRYPSARIDHIFVSDGVVVEKVVIPRSALARVASDHLPLVADLKLAPTSAAKPSDGTTAALTGGS